MGNDMNTTALRPSRASDPDPEPPSARPELRWCIAMVAIILLAVVGAAINVESTDVYLNLRVAPDDYVSSCNISETVNCDAVEQSPWAALWGVPTALWAVVGYLIIAGLALVGLLMRRRRRERGLLLLLSSFCVGLGLWLVYLMAFEIGAWCTLCLATDAVNVGMLVMVLLACRADGCSPVAAVKGDLRWLMRTPSALTAHLALGGLAVAGGFAANATWVAPPIAAAAAARDVAAKQAPSAASGVTQLSENESGHPWMGAPTPKLTIDEFTDYECPHCRSAHMRMRHLLSQHPGQVRLVHRHFPLDGACNPLLEGRVFHPRARGRLRRRARPLLGDERPPLPAPSRDPAGEDQRRGPR